MQEQETIGAAISRNFKNTVFAISAIIQCVFFAYYGYCLYSNCTPQKRTFFILYLCLLLIALFSFARDIRIQVKSLKKNAQVSRSIKFFKLVSNGSMLVVNIVQMIKFKPDGAIEVFMFIGSLLLWIAQVLFEIITITIINSVERIKSYVRTGAGDLERGFTYEVECTKLTSSVEGELTVLSEKRVDDEIESEDAPLLIAETSLQAQEKEDGQTAGSVSEEVLEETEDAEQAAQREEKTEGDAVQADNESL